MVRLVLLLIGNCELPEDAEMITKASFIMSKTHGIVLVSMTSINSTSKLHALSPASLL